MSTTVPAWTKWRGLCEAMTPWAATPIGVWRGAWLPPAHPPPYLVLPHCISAPLVQRVEGSVPPAQTRTQKTDGVTLHWLNTGGQHFIYMPFHYSLSLSIDTLPCSTPGGWPWQKDLHITLYQCMLLLYSFFSQVLFLLNAALF